MDMTKGIIVKTKTGQEIGHNFIIVKRSISSSQFIRKILDLAEVIIRGKVMFLGGGQFYTDLNNLSMGSGGEHAVQSNPRISHSLGHDNITENVLGHGRE
jgi:hypothetical protein